MGSKGDRNAIALRSKSLAGKKLSTSAWIKSRYSTNQRAVSSCRPEMEFLGTETNPLVGFSLSETGYKKARYSRAKSQPGIVVRSLWGRWWARQGSNL